MRIDGGEFRQTLQGDQEMTTGRLDTRFAGPDIDPLSQRANYDPQSSALSSAYISAFNDYARRELHWTPDEAFKPSIGIYRTWNFEHQQPGATPPIPSGTPANVLPDLANAMKINPTLKVQLNAGYFDLATPFYQGVYEMHHLPMPVKLQDNIEYKFYDSGHMVYAKEASLKALHDNVAGFIRRTSAARRRQRSRRAGALKPRSLPAARAHDVRQLRDARENTRELRQAGDLDRDLHASQVIAWIGARGHAPDAYLLIRERRADIAHEAPPVERLDLDVHGKLRGARCAPGDGQNACRRLDREPGEIRAGLGVDGDAASDGDVADDRLGRHRLAALGVGGEQIPHPLDLELRLALHGRPGADLVGARRTGVQQALNGGSHLRRC